VFDKAHEYLRAGTRLVWVIDPEAKTAWAYRPGSERLTLTMDDALDGADVLAGFTLPLAELFADPL
jgi:Uma2 family endonuclease